MNVISQSKSVHDREKHQQAIRGILGADLFETTEGTPRKIFGTKYVLKTMTDKHHEKAKQVVNSLSGFLPYSTRNNPRNWNNYGLLGPEFNHIITITPDYRSYGLPKHIGEHHLLTNHIFMRQSLLPSYGNEVKLDALMIDIDVEIRGEKTDLYLLTDDERATVLKPCHDAVKRVREAVGEFQVEWMLSGSKGFWLHVFFDGTGSREDAQVLKEAIVSNLDMDFTQTSNGKLTGVDGDILYAIDKDNLGKSVCRIPWSMHQLTNNVSINVNPETGRPEILQFAETPPNPLSLKDFAASIPSSLQKTTSYHIPISFSSPQDPLDSSIPSFPPFEPEDAEDSVFDMDDFFTFEVDSASERDLEQEDLAQRVPEESPEGKGDTEEERGDHTCRNGIGSNDKKKHLLWDWKDIIRESRGECVLISWEDLVIRDAVDGEKHERIVRSGNLLLVAAAMKGQLGEIDWEKLIAVYEQAYANADFSNGGTIRDWVNSLRKDYNHGEKIKPFRPGLTKEEVKDCRLLVQNIIASIKSRRPSEEELFHVLLCLCRLMKGSQEREIAVDFLARRSGLNPYPTWEEQKQAEFDENDSNYMNGEYPKHPRDYPSSVAARMRLGRLLHYLCDMKGEVSGTKPFVRIKIGVPSWASPTGRGEGSLFKKVESHWFWTEALAAA